jgi:hypothetical protein
VHLLETHLQEKRSGLPADEARLRRDALRRQPGGGDGFEADGYRALRDDILAMLEKADGADAVHRLTWSERLADAEDVMLALTALRSLLRDLAAARAGATADRMLNADVGDRLVALGQGRWPRGRWPWPI